MFALENFDKTDVKFINPEVLAEFEIFLEELI
jgi:hypothetical protein